MSAAGKEVFMLNPTSLLADALGQNLADTYRRIYGDEEPHIASALDEAAGSSSSASPAAMRSITIASTPHSSPSASRKFCADAASSAPSRRAIGAIPFWPR